MTPIHSTIRFERKLIPHGFTLEEVLLWVRLHPALFQEIYAERVINNVYLDSPGLRSYHEHVNGDANRAKVRLRWYGAFSGPVERPQLEYKIKRGLVGAKATCALPPFEINGHLGRDAFEVTLRHDSLPAETRLGLLGLEPALVNRYQRRYFASACGRFRLTVDWGLRFMSPQRPHEWLPVLPPLDSMVVMELKYASDQADQAGTITNGFPFRVTRCSKYILGIQALVAHGWVEI